MIGESKALGRVVGRSGVVAYTGFCPLWGWGDQKTGCQALLSRTPVLERLMHYSFLSERGANSRKGYIMRFLACPACFQTGGGGWRTAKPVQRRS